MDALKQKRRGGDRRDYREEEENVATLAQPGNLGCRRTTALRGVEEAYLP